MSTTTQKGLAIQSVAAQAHSGAPAQSVVDGAVKTLFTAETSTVDAPATTYALTHSESDQYLKLTGLTAATTANFTAGSDLPIGALITIHVVQGATPYNFVAGTGATGLGITGVANDEDVAVFKYVAKDTWVQVSTEKVVDAA